MLAGELVHMFRSVLLPHCRIASYISYVPLPFEASIFHMLHYHLYHLPWPAHHCNTTVLDPCPAWGPWRAAGMFGLTWAVVAALKDTSVDRVTAVMTVKDSDKVVQVGDGSLAGRWARWEQNTGEGFGCLVWLTKSAGLERASTALGCAVAMAAGFLLRLHAGHGGRDEREVPVSIWHC